MQFSLEKEDQRKKKMDSSNPSYQSMDCNRFISSIRIFFICLKMFINHATEKTAEIGE